jgi:hypothetical protein
VSASWKFGGSRSLILLIAVSACVGVCIYQAKQFARATQREKTTSAYDLNVQYQLFRGLRFNYYRCDYDFDVDGVPYSGHGDCPQPGNDSAIKGQLAASAGTSADAIVYYDPVDPSVNSLMKFDATSERCYQDAIPWILLEALIVLSFFFGAALSAHWKGNDGVVIDARGTVLYPDEIDRGSVHDGLSSNDGKAERFEPNSNREAAKTENSASGSQQRELYLEVVNQIHPDRAANEHDLALRERLMKEANAAFGRGDTETLRRVLEEYKNTLPT